MSAHPRLAEADKEIRSAQDVVSALRGRRDALAVELVNEALGTDHRPYEMEHGHWLCPDDMLEEGERPREPVSPTGRCVYLPNKDTCRDRCIFCGGPEERK